MKTKPEEKGVSVESAIRVTINGQTFELSKADATKLRDQLDDAVGEQPAPYIPTIPYPVPVPAYPSPWWDGPILVTSTPCDTLPRLPSTICHSLQ